MRTYMTLTITQELWDAAREETNRQGQREPLAQTCVLTRAFRESGFTDAWTGTINVFGLESRGSAWRLTPELLSIRQAFDRNQDTHPLLPYTFDYEPAPTGVTDALAEERT